MKRFLILAFLGSSTLWPQVQKKVVITAPGTWYSPLGEKELAELRAAAPGLRIVKPEPAQLMSELADADGILGVVTPEILRAAPKVQWVQIGSAGAERALFPEMLQRPITLTNCRIVQGPEIADHAFALLLALTRQLPMAVRKQQTAEWNTKDYRPLELHGKSALVVGVGGIGMQIAIRAHAFGMKVTGVDPQDLPYVPYLERTVRPDRLDDVLPLSDVVFVAAPATKETHNLISSTRIQRMKRGSFFIAVSRGTLFDNAALADALASGHLAGAGLDVTEPEPLPAGHPLWKQQNIVITPHVAGRSDGESARYLALYKENLRRFSRGEPLLHVVDKQKGY
jgi:phosphoglycerate dehydrogenase-like enzyme